MSQDHFRETPGAIGRGYFSPYHFARDYLYSAAAVLLSGVAAALASGTLPSLARSTLQSVSVKELPVAQLLVATLLFFVSSHGLGLVANAMAMQIINCSWGLKCSRRHKANRGRSLYDKHYEESEAPICKLHEECFRGAAARDASDTPMGPGDKMRQLIEFCRQHERAGYVHLARSYAIVSFHRQVLVYFGVLATTFGCHRRFLAASLLGLVCVLELVVQATTVRDTAEDELHYVSATCSRLRREWSLRAKGGQASLGPQGALRG